MPTQAWAWHPATTHNFGAAVKVGLVGAAAGAIGGAASYGAMAAVAGGLGFSGASTSAVTLAARFGGTGAKMLMYGAGGAAGGGAGGFAGGFGGGLVAGQSFGEALESSWSAAWKGALIGGALGAGIPLVAAGLKATGSAIRTGAVRLAGRRSTGGWFRFWSDRGGSTSPVSYGSPYTGRLRWANRLGLRQGYKTVVSNRDITGSWFARTDTAVHEGFHAMVAKHTPSIWRLGDLRIGPVPIGAPIKYLEEVAAYAIGHAGSLRIHAVPLAPLEAFGSMTAVESVTTVTLGAAAYGGCRYFSE